MKLWILKARKDLPDDEEPFNPWFEWFDKVFMFVIRAETEQEARQIATENGSYEIARSEANRSCDGCTPDAWLNPIYSTCEELPADGPIGVIVRDVHRG